MQAKTTGITILVGIDFSECSERALLRAITLAEQYGAQLELVHVCEWEGGDAAQEGAANGACAAAPCGLWPAANLRAQSAKQRLARLCSEWVADRATAAIRVLLGDPAMGLLKAAEQTSASLIVIGEIGRRLIPRGTIGMTAERVCQNSTLPVLLVPLVAPPEESPRAASRLTARDQLSWSCVHCGTLRLPGETAGVCTSCGDSSATWVSLHGPRVLFASPQ